MTFQPRKLSSKAVAEEITKLMIKKIEESGKLPWERPWISAMNYATKRAYNGMNTMITGMAGFESPYWLTFNQVRAMGGCVNKGSKATKIYFAQRITIDKNKGKSEEEDNFSFFMYKEFNIFNAEQISGIEFKKIQTIEFDKDENFSQIDLWIEEMTLRPELKFGGQSAYYRPSTDCVQMPPKDTFKTQAQFYSVLVHEFAHATGAEKRLNRDGIKSPLFGTELYSKEELVAELTACMILTMAGVSNEKTETNSAAYLQSWVRKFKDTPKMLMEASREAEKAMKWICGLNEKVEEIAEAEAA